MYILGFNGQPQCGKDTTAEMLLQHMETKGVDYPVIQTSLSLPLRRLAFTMVNHNTHKWEDPEYEQFKVTKFPEFGDATGRELMIDLSEKFLKPTYGDHIMAGLLLKTLPLELPGLVLLRDSGFQVEVDPLIEAVDEQNFAVVKVLRAGHDSFAGDSREWVRHPRNEHNLLVLNGGTLEDLQRSVALLYRQLTDNLGWTFR